MVYLIPGLCGPMVRGFFLIINPYPMQRYRRNFLFRIRAAQADQSALQNFPYVLAKCLPSIAMHSDTSRCRGLPIEIELDNYLVHHSAIGEPLDPARNWRQVYDSP